MVRVSKPPEERRAELLAAARELFDEKGVDKTRVQDVVKRVGVAQGVFYYYFKSKEEIVQAVMGLVEKELRGKTDAILADASANFCQKLAGLIELYIDLVDQMLGDDETSLKPLVDHRDVRDLSTQSGKILLGSLEALVNRGVQQGDIAIEYPRETVQVLLYGLRQLAVCRLPGRKMIYVIAEQSLGLPKGNLLRYGSFG